MARRRGTYKRRRTYPRRTYRRFRRYGKRRTFRRIGNSYRQTRQNAVGFSRSQIVKLRYVQQVALNPVASTSAYIIWRANDIQLPNETASGGVATTSNHQPYGYDQWAQIYNDYVVIGSKITISALPPNSTNGAASAGDLALFLSDSATAYTNSYTQIETGRAVFKQLAALGSSGRVILRKGFGAKKFWNLANLKDNITRVGAAVGASPNEKAYYHLYWSTNDTSITTSAGPFCWAIIDYYVIFTGPSDLASS